jgi:Fur family zinc uptake transcriptional regulator
VNIRAPTANRRRRCDENDTLVLDVLRQANRPLSAYDIAEQAGALGAHIVANQVYRTLARLIDMGSVLRIETLNAYIVQQSAANICLVCSDCHMIELVEMPGIRRAIVDAAPASHFKVLSGLIEAQGQCVDCRKVGLEAE